ncbi:MAG: HepT-like ribonuclease domain-containing protein [Blastocatellia bacterium]
MTGDQVYLRHILDAIERIESYVSVGRDVFLATPHWQDATIRQLEIVGEATKRLSDELRNKYSQIPWRRIAGLRDVLIHNYLGVDLAAVWEITQRNLPDLKTQVQAILQELSGAGES